MANNGAEIWLRRVKKNVVEGRTKNYWIKVKKKRGFVNILIGEKGEKAHAYIGLNPDTSKKFIQDIKQIKFIRRDRILPNGEAVLIEEDRFSNSEEESNLIIDFNYRIKNMDENQVYSSI